MMRFMSWWGEKPQQILDEPAPIAPPLDRVEQTQQRVREIKSELDTLDAEMLKFKKEHRVRTNRFGVLLGIECASLTGRPEIERDWRALLRRRDGLMSAWHRALFEWSEAKGAAK